MLNANFRLGKAENAAAVADLAARPDASEKLRVEALREQLDQERWQNWQLRQQQFYGRYYSQPVVVYHDPYSSPFWY